MSETFPARLHVVLARDKRVAVVFRRGPSDKVCTLLWDRRGDRFTLGQWMKGRIYERRADLSPDGRYLIYFAMNGKWSSEAQGAWTAVSKAPWLKAISLYPKGDCWEGGGLFLTNDTFWLNDRYFGDGRGHIESNKVRRDERYVPEGQFGAEDTGVYYRRLLRDGWTITDCRQNDRLNALVSFEKSCPKGWVLKKLAHEQVGAPVGKGCYWDEHELLNAETNQRISCTDWEWADLDGKTLVWAEQGRLYRAAFKSRSVLGPAKLLYDFNPLQFEARPAPY